MIFSIVWILRISDLVMITMDVPNAETIQAMKDTKNKIGLSKGFSSVSELMEDLDADD